MEDKNTNQIIEDIDFLERQLLKKHPDPFRHISQKDFTAHIQEIRVRSNSTGVKDLGMEIMKLLAKLNDAHTELDISYFGSLVFPFKFRYISDGFYTVSTSLEYQQYLGWKLVAINNKPIDEIKKVLRAIIPIENEMSENYYLSSKLVEPKILNYFNVIKDFECNFHFQKDNKEIVVRSKALHYSTKLIDIFKTIKELDWTLQKEGLYKLQDIPELDTVYLQYNECTEMKEYTMQQVANDIQKFNRKNLIIDLRNNLGGDSDVLNPVLNYIKENENNLKIFILIGVDTYSSAIYNLMELIEFRNTTTIGDIPHGNPTHFGEVESFKLPNSQLQIFISTKIFKEKEYRIGDSFKPDYFVQHTPDTLLKGKDAQFRYLKEKFL